MLDGMVAIVGRPNVGKSTLFNRMTRTDNAIVDDRPGVTRDRLCGTVWTDEDEGEGFLVVDTGGFETDDFKFQPFAENLVWQQTEAAIQEADVVLLVLDGKHGLHQHDHELVRYLKNMKKPFIAIANKIDGIEHEAAAWEFFSLGLDEVLNISAAHNRGVGDMKVTLADKIKEINDVGEYVDVTEGTRISIVGRPNAGKSSLLNRLIGEERALVSDVAGTTRDSIDTPLAYNGNKYVLIDTAGIRRKTKIYDRVESLSVMRAIKNIHRADVVFLVIDAIEGLTDQDARLAEQAIGRCRPLAIVVNKWDLVKNKNSNSPKEYAADLRLKLKTISFIPIHFVSCLTNQRVHGLMNLVEELMEQFNKRAPTYKVNELLKQIVYDHNPALIRNHSKRIKFYFGTQVTTAPPTIVVFCNVEKEIQEAYKRYMTHRFRKELGFNQIPIRIYFRAKEAARKKDEELRESLDVEATLD
jgi:GTPase